MYKKSIITFAIIILLLAVGFGVWRYYTKSYSTVSVNNKLIKTGVRLHREGQQDPAYQLKTSNGHYLIRIWDFDKKADKKGTQYYANRLVYDGQIIYSNTNNDLLSFALSNDGRHYAYSIQDGNDLGIYADGKKNTTINNSAASGLKILEIANNGSLFYTDASGINLLENGQVILKHQDGFLGLKLSNDAYKYLADLRNMENGNFVESLSLNGKEIYKGGELRPDGPPYVFSHNGNHYGYIMSKINEGDTLVIDGNVVLKGGIYNLQITDTGHWAVSDTASNKSFVDGISYPYKVVYINDNASHILSSNYNNDNDWELDGKPVNINRSSEYFNIDFADNTIYTYSVSE